MIQLLVFMGLDEADYIAMGFPCMECLVCGDCEHAERYVRQCHLRKANNRCDHRTEQIRVYHWVCNNKVKNNGKETYKLSV